jgi:hypothetical protein
MRVTAKILRIFRIKKTKTDYGFTARLEDRKEERGLRAQGQRKF